MQKQTTISLAIAVLAFAVGALIYLAAPQSKLAGPTSPTTSNTAQAPAPVGSVPSNLIIPPVPPVPTDETRLPFNGHAPSVIGTVTSVTSSTLVLEITEQPKDKPGLVTREQTVKLTNSTDYTFAANNDGTGAGEAKRQDIKEGMTVTVFVKDAADLESNEFTATSVEIRL